MKTKTLTNFTAEYEYDARDFYDLGEAGLINESLKAFFADPVFESAGKFYDIDRVTSLEVKVVPETVRVRVILFGQAEVAGL